MSLHYNNEVKAKENTSKLKEGREVVLVLACHPSNTTLTYSLSFTLMAKTTTRTTTTTTLNLKTRLQKLAKALDLPFFRPHRGYL